MKPITKNSKKFRLLSAMLIMCLLLVMAQSQAFAITDDTLDANAAITGSGGYMTPVPITMPDPDPGAFVCGYINVCINPMVMSIINSIKAINSVITKILNATAKS